MCCSACTLLTRLCARPADAGGAAAVPGHAAGPPQLRGHVVHAGGRHHRVRAGGHAQAAPAAAARRLMDCIALRDFVLQPAVSDEWLMC